MEFADNLNRLADSLKAAGSLLKEAAGSLLKEAAGASAFNRGIERETLRTSMDGALAATPHPKAFGSKLTHPLITTDFSEAQLELITGVHGSVQGLVAELALIHRAVCQGLGDGDNDELLWAASMPCLLDSAAPIPLAHYGKSNLGRLKTTYRSGLGLRYGRAMQTVCAVHYNFSLSDKLWAALQEREGDPAPAKDYRSKRYFDLMRNFHRYSWLLVYLFGASPAVCNSFLRDRQHELLPFDDSTAYLPHATSLRSSNLGYRSDTQSAEMNPCYNSLDTYVNGLASAICKPYPPYARLGEQVNANVLQSEAEFYTSIRAKRAPAKGENFLAGLLAQGVQYLEVRLLDANPYLPLGIDATEINFLDAFLTFCLMTESPSHDDAQCQEVDDNMKAAVLNGRDPDLHLSDAGQVRKLTEWGGELLAGILTLAETLDAGGGSDYQDAVREQQAKLQDAYLTPSGRILQDMQQAQLPFFRFAMDQSLAHRQQFLAEPLSQDEAARFDKLREESLAAQVKIEQADKIPFDEYLQKLQGDYEALVGKTLAN